MTKRLASARGFTLLELTIVTAIIVMAAMLVIPSVEGAMGVQTREEAGKLAGSIRAMYGEAVLQGKTCRIVFDIDHSTWWPECAPGKLTIARTEESDRGARVEEKKTLDIPASDDEKAARKLVEEKGTFTKYEAKLAPKEKMPERVKIQGVFTPHQTQVYDKGLAYLYFFPQGQTESAYVYLASGDDVYTVRADSVTGRTKVDAEKIAIPDRLLK